MSCYFTTHRICLVLFGAWGTRKRDTFILCFYTQLRQFWQRLGSESNVSLLRSNCHKLKSGFNGIYGHTVIILTAPQLGEYKWVGTYQSWWFMCVCAVRGWDWSPSLLHPSTVLLPVGRNTTHRPRWFLGTADRPDTPPCLTLTKYRFH